jgi:hypothetical protein
MTTSSLRLFGVPPEAGEHGRTVSLDFTNPWLTASKIAAEIELDKGLARLHHWQIV